MSVETTEMQYGHITLYKRVYPLVILKREHDDETGLARIRVERNMEKPMIPAVWVQFEEKHRLIAYMACIGRIDLAGTDEAIRMFLAIAHELDNIVW